MSGLEPHQLVALEQLSKLGEQRMKRSARYFVDDAFDPMFFDIAQPPAKHARFTDDFCPQEGFHLSDQDGLLQFTPPESPELGEDPSEELLDFSEKFYVADDYCSSVSSTVPPSPAPTYNMKEEKATHHNPMFTPPLSPHQSQDEVDSESQICDEHKGCALSECHQENSPLNAWAHLFSPTVVALLTMFNCEDEANQQGDVKPCSYAQGVRQLVEAHGDNICTILDGNGYSIVHYAAFEGSVDTLRFIAELFSNEEMINMVDAYNNTPLHWAVTGNQQEAVAYLVELGASVVARNNEGMTPCKLCCEADLAVLLDIMLKSNKSPINEQEDSTGLSLLHVACASGSLNAVETLIQHGAQPLLRDATGTTPTITAVCIGHNHLLETMLHDRNVMSVCDRLGRTPLHWAAAIGNIDAVKILVKNGAKLEMRDRRGRTPLLLAALANHREVIDFLLSRKASTNVEDYEGVVMPPLRR